MVKRKSNWSEYFLSIKPVCPWSHQAFLNNAIEIKTWRGQCLPLYNLEARVYVYNRSPRLLKKLASKLERLYPEYEFLYSHPSWKYNSTPLPVIIQQDKSKLYNLRQKIGYFTTT